MHNMYYVYSSMYTKLVHSNNSMHTTEYAYCSMHTTSSYDRIFNTMHTVHSVVCILFRVLLLLAIMHTS